MKPILQITTAEVAAGEHQLSFPIDLPNPTTVNSGRYDLKAVALKAHGLAKPEPYELRTRLNFLDGSDSYNTFLQTPFSENSTPKTVGDQLAGAGDRAKVHFKDFQVTPTIVAEEANANGDIQFVVELPAYTALFSDNPDFFRTLGFDEEAIVNISSMVQNVKTTPKGTPSYGFFNVQPGLLRISSITHLVSQPMDLFYEAVMKEQPAGQFKIEYHYFTDWMFTRTRDARPYNRLTATQTLANMIEDGVATLNLDPALFLVESDGVDGIAIRQTGAARPNSKLEFQIMFPPNLAEFLNLSDDPVLTFPLFDPRRYVIQPKEALEEKHGDLNKSRYPIGVVLNSGQAIANNYIHGLGRVAMLGLMLDVDTVVGEGATLFGQAQELRMRLYDSQLQPLVHKTPVTYTLSLIMTESIVGK